MGMSKYDRLLYILNLLRSRRSLNAQRLAEECQVTERSIYRDIISLSEANIPIYFDNGYKLASGNFLPALNFSPEEYSYLKLALESSPLAKAGDKGTILKQIKAKIDSGLSETTRQKKKTTPATSHIDIETTAPRPVSTRFYGLIESAIADQTCLKIDYFTIEHGLTTRTVDPYFIMFRRHAFYFVAFCHLRKEFRTFRIDRTKKIQATPDLFSRKRGIHASDYFADSWQLYHGEPVGVVVRFRGASARVVTASQHHSKESIEKVGPDELIYRVKVNGTEEIGRWLLGFGGDVEVLEPAELREIMLKAGQAIAGNHSDD